MHLPSAFMHVGGLCNQREPARLRLASSRPILSGRPAPPASPWAQARRSSRPPWSRWPPWRCSGPTRQTWAPSPRRPGACVLLHRDCCCACHAGRAGAHGMHSNNLAVPGLERLGFLGAAQHAVVGTRAGRRRHAAAAAARHRPDLLVGGTCQHKVSGAPCFSRRAGEALLHSVVASCYYLPLLVAA